MLSDHLFGKHLFAVVLILAVGGCYRPSDYSGDGKLVDNGLFSATDRYVLKLGPVALDQTTIKTYRLENLPDKEFVLGIKLTRAPGTPSFMDKRPVKAAVAIELKDKDGAILVQRKGPLNGWTWNTPATDDWSFIYGREAPSTFFVGKRDPLHLTVRVESPDPTAMHYAPVLVARSGGWK